MNSLRSLAVDIMFNTGADKLLQVDSAVDGVKSNAIEAATNMDALGESTEAVGDKSKGLGSIADNWLAITGAGVALGGALMKVTGKADELNQGLRRLEVQTGETEAELREMLISIMDETWDPKMAVQSMEELIKMGITTREEFERVLPVFDTFGDATGKTMVEGINSMNAVLSALDIPMTESEEHIDTLTWLTQGSTVAMGDLGRTMRREQARIRDMGLTFEDIAVAMAALEAEGIKGPRAIMGFQRAIQEAEGDVQAFWEGLGVTSEALQEQNDLLLQSEGLTQALADTNNQSLGVWDKLKHKFDMTMWSLGSFLEPVKDLGPLLIAVGPAIKGVSAALTFLKGPVVAATVAGWKFTAMLLANPLTWIVVLIMALIGAFVLLWKNWDTVSGWLSASWEWLKTVASNVWDGIVDIFTGVWNWISDLFGNMATAAWDWGKNLIEGLIGGIKDMWNKGKETISNFAGGIADSFKSFFKIKSPSRLMMEYGADIVTGLQIGMDDDVPEIPVPQFEDTSASGSQTGVRVEASFNPQVDIHIHGNADGHSLKQELKTLFPELMEEFFELVALKMGGSTDAV